MSSLFLIVAFIVIYAVVILPQSRRRKRTQALQRSVEPGARIMLTSGMFATVHAVEDDKLVVEIADGVRVEVVKAAVMRVLPDEVEDAHDADDDYDAADHDDHDDHDGHDDHDQHTQHDGDDDAPGPGGPRGSEQA